MKDWQHGYDLEYLKEVESHYKAINTQIRSPFNQYKKNNIAADLHAGELVLKQHPYMPVVAACYKKEVAKARSKITMHGDTLIGYKEKGDVIFSQLTGDAGTLRQEIGWKPGWDCWLILYPWQRDLYDIALEVGYRYIGSKINTFSDITLYLFKDNAFSLSPRTHPPVYESEKAAMVKIMRTDPFIRHAIMKKLNELKPEFINHYSNYNKGDSWSALSLRGYSPDPAFIEKPAEMSKAWHEEHINETFELQDTPLYEHFPMIRAMLAEFKTAVHRVRFMKLKPGGGELERHTDQVDPDVGTTQGKIIRLHFPLQTNPGVVFSTWDCWDQKQSFQYCLDEVWYLDTRKPHTAINNGTQERIHLVVDLEVTEALQELITEQFEQQRYDTLDQIIKNVMTNHEVPRLGGS